MSPRLDEHRLGDRQVCGRRRVKGCLAGFEAMSSEPPSWRLRWRPRPCRRRGRRGLLTVSAVEKPASRMKTNRSRSDRTRIGLHQAAFDRTCGGSRRDPCRRRRRHLQHDFRTLRARPRRGPCLPRPCRLRRASGVSKPCASALRSMCSSGAVMRSSTLRSSSPCAPRRLSCACLPSSPAVWRMTRRRRGTRPSNGTMRVRMRPSCRSELTRDCCSSRVSVLTGQVVECALQRRQVGYRFGQRARKLLQRRETIELQRIELGVRRFVPSRW
jgi:hypothetical protein